MVVSPIAIAFNVKGVTSLTLDGLTAAQIFNGQINMWNDGAIQLQNLGVQLPDEPIHVVFRSDESGTTDNFQKYLDTASKGTWGFPAGQKFNGGIGEGAVGNDGAAEAVKNTEGSITYLAWSFAQSQHLNTASIITSAGPDPVAISPSRWARRSPPPGSSRRATTSPSTPSRSTGPTSPALTRSCWRRMRSCVRSTRIPQVGTAVEAFLQSAIGTGQKI